jgi:hypothetical protein
MVIPQETEEAQILAQYCDLKGFIYTKTAQETYTGYKQSRKNKEEWVRPWLPDFIVLGKSVYFIELKRQRAILKNGKRWASPSNISDPQKKWAEKLQSYWKPIVYLLAYGSKEAIQMLEKEELSS